jgi:murein L,D-transpeptidase YcbB/YkuD
MIRLIAGALAALMLVALAAKPAVAGGSEDASRSPDRQPPAVGLPPATAASEPAAAVRGALSRLPMEGTDEDQQEHLALDAFYAARGHAPLWQSSTGALTPKASLIIAELGHADAWGLDPRDFSWPSAPDQGAPDAIAEREVGLSLAILKYARFARGGRIIYPAGQLSSYLDRRPQLLKPLSILEGIAAADAPDAYLRGLNPQHAQFERLRQQYLAARSKAASGRGSGGLASAEAKRLLANMEEWRWMPADLGELYILNNVPEFLQRVVKNGEVIRTERIVAGEIGKQTPIFSRMMRTIVFKPTWKVPDSIKVKELWPSLLRGGGLMREWGLELLTKDGQPRDWRTMNWATTDIREYDVIQPNGPKSVMGKVKFSFPNPHTVFMHDTLPRDRYMFNAAQRTFSHGCMRVGKPLHLAEILLREDKGWDAARVAEVFTTGPLNNEIAIDHKIPVHITYFTAWVGDDGKLRTFADVYGHERRILLALEGKWEQIVKGRDHLAPVELNLATAQGRAEEDAVPGRRAKREPRGGGADFPGAFSSVF